MITMEQRRRMLWSAKCRSTTRASVTSADLDYSQSLIQNLVRLSEKAPSVHLDIPPEVTNYVESSRNPDIYTREFVELVQRTNQMLKGREEAYRFLQEQVAWQLSSAVPELKADVARVVESSGGRVPAWDSRLWWSICWMSNLPNPSPVLSVPKSRPLYLWNLVTGISEHCSAFHTSRFVWMCCTSSAASVAATTRAACVQPSNLYWSSELRLYVEPQIGHGWGILLDLDGDNSRNGFRFKRT